MERGHAPDGGINTCGLPYATQLPICATYTEFLESVALYGIGAIKVSTLKQGGFRMASPAFLREAEEASRKEKAPS